MTPEDELDGLKEEQAQTRMEALLAMCVTDPTEANAIATIMIWRLLKSIAVILIVMDMALLAIFWELALR